MRYEELKTGQKFRFPKDKAEYVAPHLKNDICVITPLRYWIDLTLNKRDPRYLNETWYADNNSLVIPFKMKRYRKHRRK